MSGQYKYLTNFPNRTLYFKFFSPGKTNSEGLTNNEEIISLPIQRDIMANDIVVTLKTTQSLIESGLFIKSNNDMIHFVNPLITGFYPVLPSMMTMPKIEQPLNWSVVTSLLKYRIAKTVLRNGSMKILLIQTYLHYTGLLLLLGKWVSESPITSEWRIDLMRKLLNLITVDTLPFPIKARIMTLYTTSNDQNVSKLLKQLFSTNSIPLKFLQRWLQVPCLILNKNVI